MKIKWKKLNRTVHYWGSAIIVIPVLIVIVTGIILQLKKEADWIQPPTIRGQGDVPSVTFDEILSAAKSVPEAQITGWGDINRLDVRPSKGVIKIRSKNEWEIQIDHQSKAVIQVAYRRSDWIESIHDGSFFHKHAKLWLFLPAAIILLILWGTGLYMFIITLLAKNKKKKKNKKSTHSDNVELT